MTGTICTVAGCDRPTHDGWYICDPCGRDLTRKLEQTRWMLDELDTVTALQTRYTAGVGNVARASDEQPLPFNPRAAELRRALVMAVADACAHVIARHPEWRKDDFWANPGEPRSHTPVLASAWLTKRITGLRLHPEGGKLYDEIMRRWASCTWIIDRPPELRYLGICSTDCDGNACGGTIYQHGGKPEATCDRCRGTWDADGVEALRVMLLAELDAHTGTAAEIANLSTYLGLSIGRLQVRKLVNSWHHRKQLTSVGDRDGSPIFRLIEARALLERNDATRRQHEAS